MAWHTPCQHQDMSLEFSPSKLLTGLLWLCRNGLTIALTLHHFVQPLWFDDMGGFTRPESIPHFVNFASIAFRCAPRPSPCSIIAPLQLSCTPIPAILQYLVHFGSSLFNWLLQ